MKDSWQKYAVTASKEDKTGLCSNCNHRQTCCYLERASQPILHCEEFFAHTPETTRSTTQVRTRTDGGGDVDKFNGLCVNCDFRLDCKNAGKEGGVWHCEEYA